MSGPVPLEEAQVRLLALAHPLPVERVDIPGALGRYLAEPVLARRTQPACDLSAMDGYAIAAGDMAGPWRVIGESAAGHPFSGEVAAGQAVRISTGAVLPRGAGAVIVQEDIVCEGDTIVLTGTPPSPADRHIRRAGLDFRQGDVVLAEGNRVGPAHVALAIAAGHSHLPVRRAPRVAVIDSGDELAPNADTCADHQVPASNGVMLSALLATSVPCALQHIGPVADDVDALVAAFDAALPADIIVTSGGASVGDHDLLRPALETWGAEIEFWKVAMKPGKPLLVATRGDGPHRTIIVGLPGNPVSSHVTAFLFVLPLLRALLGAETCLPHRIVTELARPLPASGSRREFLRAHWDGTTLAPSIQQDSSALASLAASNALLDRPALSPPAQAGERVAAYLLGNGGIL